MPRPGRGRNSLNLLFLFIKAEAETGTERQPGAVTVERKHGHGGDLLRDEIVGPDDDRYVETSSTKPDSKTSAGFGDQRQGINRFYADADGVLHKETFVYSDLQVHPETGNEFQEG